jgi:hypothetical protein
MAIPEIHEGEYTLLNTNNDLDASYTTLYSQYLNKINNVDSTGKTIQNNKRNIEINQNAILKYKAQSLVLKKIIVICCIALIGSFLFYLNILPDMMYNIYLGIVFGIGFIIIMYDLYNIFIRNSNDFNQYDYEFLYKPPMINSNETTNYNTIQLSNIPTVCK